MGLTRLAIYRPLAILMLILGLVLMGGVAFTRLRVDRLPPQSFPVLSVSANWVGASPEDVESLILQPLEDAVSGLSGLSGVTATAREGSGSLFLQFAEGTNTDTAAIDAERRLATVRNRLPADASAPTVRKFDPNASSIMNVAFTGAGLQQLFDFANDVVEPQLLSVPGVADVSLSGGLRQEVRITLDPVRLEAYKLSVEQVQTALVRENISSPIGTVDQGRSTVAVRSLGLFQNLNDLSGLIITSGTSGPVYLRNVATITQGNKTQTSIQRFNGLDAVGLSIIKQSDANTIEVANQIRAALDKLRPSLPDGSQLVVTNDASRFVRSSLESVERDLILSIFLTATVLLLFLHSWRNTIIIVLAIPTSLISTFLVMYIFG
ncbi:MAG: efflux RND transporter permease subunit, partial [Chloroflexi bacterium]|nr:efflux RND transporter permease subunit [Chloroflexota bacterium]